MRAFLAIAVLAACGGPEAAAPAPCAPPTLELRGFRSKVTPRMGSPRHVADDVIVAVGSPFALRAKLTYGKLGKDLEGEDVALFVGEGACGPWQHAADGVTDDDGAVVFQRPLNDQPGMRPFQVVAYGDGTRASGTIWAVEPDTAAVLFDVDGTLTTGDGELFEDLLGGGAPDMRAGANDVARRWAELGYLVIYVSGRPPRLRASTRQWLAERGFPVGPLLTPEATIDIVPTSRYVGAFKLAAIRALIEAGVSFAAAYGNAATDVCAYAQAGIPPARTWITQRREACDAFAAPHDLPSYVDHLPTLRDHPRAPD